VSLDFTRRKNGRDMATLKISFHVGSKEIATLLAARSDAKPDFLSVGIGEPPLPGKELSRAAAEREIRHWLWAYGDDAYTDGVWPHEDVSTEETLVVADWAAAQVRRLFPELDDEELAKWLNTFREWKAAEERRRARWRQETGSDEGFRQANEEGWIDEVIGQETN